MFLSPGEQVSVDNLLKGIVTLSGNDASVVLAECIAGTEQAFTDQMNALAQRIGVKNSHFGTANGWPDNGVTYVTARDLATIARTTIEKHPKLYKQYYSLPNFTWGKTLGAGKDITQDNRNPILGHVPGADGLKTGHTDEAGYGFTGSADENGRRLIEVLAGMASWNERVQESTRLIQWGSVPGRTSRCLPRERRSALRKVQLGSSSEVPLVAPRDLAVSVPAGLSSGAARRRSATRARSWRRSPRAGGRPARDHDRRYAAADRAAGRRRRRRPAGFFARMWLGFKSLFGMA